MGRTQLYMAVKKDSVSVRFSENSGFGKKAGIERSESVSARESKKTEAEGNVNQSYGLID